MATVAGRDGEASVAGIDGASMPRATDRVANNAAVGDKAGAGLWLCA